MKSTQRFTLIAALLAISTPALPASLDDLQTRLSNAEAEMAYQQSQARFDADMGRLRAMEQYNAQRDQELRMRQLEQAQRDSEIPAPARIVYPDRIPHY